MDKGTPLRDGLSSQATEPEVSAFRASIPSAWQPIETAPRDGTSVLLGGGNYFCEERDKDIEQPAVAFWYADVWLMCGVEGGYVWVMYHEPTHWMPLPEAPQ